ncbi:MAG: hypothetical protein KJ804_03175 [Proteobacteria bacterium]|nr:hypothetical protein [Pseudomonadota bacterium]MBU1057306.1 hypothetical protein [Pseudomonadota bacterium]
MKPELTLKHYLRVLDALIVRERTAIIYSQMKRLSIIQHEKKTLLLLMQQVERVVDQESLDLAIKIKRDNKRNELLLQSGLKLICGLRQNNNRRRSFAYSSAGSSLARGISPKILKREI